MFTLPPILLSVAGVALAVIGWRGRRLDDHPWCRRCRFDLFNTWPERVSCPECGADLGVKGAVRRGQRRRRRGMAATGVVLAFVGAVGIALTVWLQSGDSVQKYKSVWWLRMEAKSDGAASFPALVELNDRLTMGRLSQAQIDGIVDDALAVQADLNRTWDSLWGDFVEAAQTLAKLPPAKWRRYAEQAVASRYRLEVRPKVRRGDPVAYRVHQLGARVGTSAQFWLGHEGVFLHVGPIERRCEMGGVTPLGLDGLGSWAGTTHLTDGQWAAVPPGRLGVTLEAEFVLYEDRSQSVVVARTTAAFTADIEVLPADQSSLVVTSDPALRAGVEQAVRVEHLSVGYGSDGKRHLGWGGAIDRPPVAVAFSVLLRSGDHEWQVSGFDAAPGRVGYGGGTTVGDDDLSEFGSDTVDFVLRPSGYRALRTVDVLEMWGEPIVIKDVPVQWLVPKP